MSSLQGVHYHQQAGWGFYNPVELTVGRGCRSSLVEKLADQVLLIVTTQRGRRQITEDALLSTLVTQNTVRWIDSVRENPGLTDLQAEIDRMEGQSFDAVVGFGGGSAIDAAKVLNVSLAVEGGNYSLHDLLTESQLHLRVSPKPLYSVPTTSGTGSEVTPFATVWHHEVKEKLSLTGRAVWPTAAYVDAALTDSVPVMATISTGLDCINQAAESIWNKNANSITIAYATRALQLAFAALPLLADGEGGEAARDKMAEASLLSGLAISHTRTALCHSMSYPITSHFGVPHGLACAFTMPPVLRHSLLSEDGRFGQVAQTLTGSTDLKRLVACFDQMHEALRVSYHVKKYIPSLEALLALKGEMFSPERAGNYLGEDVQISDVLNAAWHTG